MFFCFIYITSLLILWLSGLAYPYTTSPLLLLFSACSVLQVKLIVFPALFIILYMTRNIIFPIFFSLLIPVWTFTVWAYHRFFCSGYPNVVTSFTSKLCYLHLHIVIYHVYINFVISLCNKIKKRHSTKLQNVTNNN